jgi:hypothetical protein
VTIEPREVDRTTQQFTYQGDHQVNGIAVPDIEPVFLYSIDPPVNWWPTWPGIPEVDPPSPACRANGTLLRERILHFRITHPDVELNFFTQAPPRCITGQPFVAGGYDGEDYAPALPQNAYREPGTIGAQVYTFVQRFGSFPWNTATALTEYVYRNAEFQFFIVGSVPIDRNISSDPVAHALFGRIEDKDQLDKRGADQLEELLAAQAAYATNGY